ncbi:MAG: hypothetical protein VKI63_05610 [Cyanobium sp.]|nr:hypothetical protein [Cyanobium sp.]
MSWEIWKQKPIVRGSIEHSTQPVMGWVRAPCWGVHATSIGAMRRYIEELDPDFKGATDGLIRRQWKAWTRSHGVRLQRVKP